MYKGNLPIGGLDNLNEVAECNRNLPRGVGEATRLSGIGGDQFTGFCRVVEEGQAPREIFLCGLFLCVFRSSPSWFELCFTRFNRFVFSLLAQEKLTEAVWSGPSLQETEEYSDTIGRGCLCCRHGEILEQGF